MFATPPAKNFPYVVLVSVSGCFDLKLVLTGINIITEIMFEIVNVCQNVQLPYP